MAIKASEREGKRHPLSLRVTAGVRKQLEEMASASGRSLTQEAEFRLEQSFERSAFHDQAGILTHVVAMAVTRSAAILQEAPLATPRERRYTFKRVAMSIQRLAATFGVGPVEAIKDDGQRQEAARIEEMAALDEENDLAAQDRWSMAFGAWSRVLEDVDISPEGAQLKLEVRGSAIDGSEN